MFHIQPNYSNALHCYMKLNCYKKDTLDYILQNSYWLRKRFVAETFCGRKRHIAETFSCRKRFVAETICGGKIFVEGNVLWQETFCGRNLLWGNIFGRLYFVGKRLVSILSKIAFLAEAVWTKIRKISQYTLICTYVYNNEKIATGL